MWSYVTNDQSVYVDYRSSKSSIKSQQVTHQMIDRCWRTLYSIIMLHNIEQSKIHCSWTRFYVTNNQLASAGHCSDLGLLLVDLVVSPNRSRGRWLGPFSCACHQQGLAGTSEIPPARRLVSLQAGQNGNTSLGRRFPHLSTASKRSARFPRPRIFRVLSVMIITQMYKRSFVTTAQGIIPKNRRTRTTWWPREDQVRICVRSNFGVAPAPRIAFQTNAGRCSAQGTRVFWHSRRIVMFHCSEINGSSPGYTVNDSLRPWRWMTRVALSKRSAARTSYEVSGLRFGYVLTVCFERLSWVPCWGPAIPPPPIPARLLSSPLHGQPRMVRRGQYGPPERPAKGTRDPFRPKGPLNDRNACRRISFIPASSSIRILLHHVFSSISLSPSVVLLNFFDLFSN